MEKNTNLSNDLHRVVCAMLILAMLILRKDKSISISNKPVYMMYIIWSMLEKKHMRNMLTSQNRTLCDLLQNCVSIKMQISYSFTH